MVFCLPFAQALHIVLCLKKKEKRRFSGWKAIKTRPMSFFYLLLAPISLLYLPGAQD
jgi:hypothetical protein